VNGLKENVNWWNIITKIDQDNSTWDHLEPAEIVELVQRIIEAKEKIKGLDNYIGIKLSPALHKLKLLVNPFTKYDIPQNYSTYKAKLKYKVKYKANWIKSKI